MPWESCIYMFSILIPSADSMWEVLQGAADEEVNSERKVVLREYLDNLEEVST